MHKISKNVEETEALAKIFLAEILKGKKQPAGATVVGLSGDLGAGKTAFTKAIAKHLGIKNKINSPTFVIMKKYPLKKNPNHEFFFHLDAYRLKNEKELLYLGWEEIIGNKDHLVFIEWPENVSKIIPKHARFINISHQKNGHRKFELK
jgi:tRNA threonylcarbamoyladenosine biosynthesis protein TsaE